MRNFMSILQIRSSEIDDNVLVQTTIMIKPTEIPKRFSQTAVMKLCNSLSAAIILAVKSNISPEILLLDCSPSEDYIKHILRQQPNCSQPCVSHDIHLVVGHIQALQRSRDLTVLAVLH